MLRNSKKFKKFFNNENVVDIMSKSVSWAKYIETEQCIGYISLKNVTLCCFLGRKIYMKQKKTKIVDLILDFRKINISF